MNSGAIRYKETFSLSIPGTRVTHLGSLCEQEISYEVQPLKGLSLLWPCAAYPNWYKSCRLVSSLSTTFLLGLYNMHFRAPPYPLISLPDPSNDASSNSSPTNKWVLESRFFFLSLHSLPQCSLSCSPAHSSDHHLYDHDVKIQISRLQCHIFIVLPY